MNESSVVNINYFYLAQKLSSFGLLFYGNFLTFNTSIEQIPDEALVVRGGRNRFEDIERSIATHPSGITGISVESAVGLSIEELTKAIPHGQIGVTTVGEVRRASGDVICTSGRSCYHATLTGLTPQQISCLLTPTIRNPAK